jgi:TolB-like protein/DNA-binding winged helix-turn-helix (wHTH) protein/Flp pilus assembly protein TadD
MPPPVKHGYQFGPFRLDPAERMLYRDGEVVPLTAKVFDILLVFVENSGRTLEKEEAMEQVWPGQFVEEGNLTRNISTLRKVLGESPDDHRYIVTIPGRGYRFVAEVREVTDEAERPSLRSNVVELAGNGLDESIGAAAAALDRTAVSDGEAVAAAGQVKRRTGVVWRVSLTVFGLALAFALYALIRERRSTPPSQITSIVVLPLQNLSGDPAQEYFADGMTDALIGELAKVGALRVISRTSAMHFKGTKKKLPEIADELKVGAVVEGTVLRSGDRVLIRAQLIHAATDRHLWGETYDRDLRDVLGLQSEVAQTIAREIQIKVTPAEQVRLAHNRSVNHKAFDDYLQGRYLYWNKRTKENLEKAIEYFQSATKEDPTYAQAYAGLADCYNQLGSVNMSAMWPVEARRQAEELAGKALELDGELAEAHIALGYVKHFNWDWAAAEVEFKRAIELKPNYADAHIRYAQYLLSRGRLEEAVAEANRAQELDPLSLVISAQRGYILERARRYPEAIEQLRSVIAMDPNNYQAHWFLGQTYAANRQFDEAIASSEKAVALSGRAPGALGNLGLAYALAGRKDEANKVLNELLGLNRRRYVTPAVVATVYIGLGDKDQAFIWLEKAFQERSYLMANLKVLPMLDPLRTDPRFDDLLRRIGLSP